MTKKTKETPAQKARRVAGFPTTYKGSLFKVDLEQLTPEQRRDILLCASQVDDIAPGRWFIRDRLWHELVRIGILPHIREVTPISWVVTNTTEDGEYVVRTTPRG